MRKRLLTGTIFLIYNSDILLAAGPLLNPALVLPHFDFPITVTSCAYELNLAFSAHILLIKIMKIELL